MKDGVQSFFIGTSGLLIVLVISAIITWSRKTPTKVAIESFQTVLVIAICFHLIHLTEETIYGFHEQFPVLLGLAPWPISLFLGFNIAWVIIWLISVFLIAPNRVTITTFWFLALASVVNAFAHPALSILVGGYFPGLISSPGVGILGFVLIRKLHHASDNG